MAQINKDSIFDPQILTLEPMYDLTIGQIIYMDENKSSEVQQQLKIPSENVEQNKKPNKTRSPVYNFFEWDEDSSKWKSTTCE